MDKLVTLNSARPLFLPFVAVMAVAGIRQLWWQYLSQFRGPLGLFAIPLIGCPFLIILFIACVILGFIIFQSVTRTRSLLPTLLLVGGIFLAFQIPLPPRPDSAEKHHFIENRADYEAIIQMIQTDGLTPCNRLGSVRTDLFEPPENLVHVSSENCIEVADYPDHGLRVSFFPLEPFYHPIVYIESGDSEYACPNDPHIEQIIDPNWYVCAYDWN